MAHKPAGSSYQPDPQQQRSSMSDHEFIARMRAELYRRPSMRLIADRVSHIMLAGRIDRDDPILELIESDDILDEKTVLSDAVEHILSFPHLSAKEVANQYNKNWANPSDALRKLSTKGEVIGLKRAGKFRYPAFQFSQSDEANQVAREGNVNLGARDDPWGVASWWLSPNPSAEDRKSPAQLLNEGSLDAVRALLDAEIADDLA
ncbi:hypothetical protein MWU77_06565 [Rhodococcus sp. F64268]|uniref:hypothetical protein n=1 Tax=unclassified Rhodococcus (in: high G+C Gram-positive bacteria) TaxID=192944 RepID=UPI00197CF6B7|nr:MULTISPECIES: hypothetical protein [unclassified Rhodococcus (in: high G+C Gram-positive bacteria)]MCK0090447.1 hypothetical protein [Rhodococcus sp. F64268]